MNAISTCLPVVLPVTLCRVSKPLIDGRLWGLLCAALSASALDEAIETLRLLEHTLRKMKSVV